MGMMGHGVEGGQSSIGQEIGGGARRDNIQVVVSRNEGTKDGGGCYTSVRGIG